jgi:hypothetical protein
LRFDTGGRYTVSVTTRRVTNDFMFVLTDSEFAGWRSQIVISNADRKGLRYADGFYRAGRRNAVNRVAQ